MDRKSIIVLLISFVVLLAWYPLMNRVYPPKPLPSPTNAIAGPTNPGPLDRAGSPTSIPTNALEFPASHRPTDPIHPRAPEELTVIENDNARYTFTSIGGGLKLVELKKYPETIACGANRKSPATNLAKLNTRAPVPAVALYENPALEGDGLFQVTKTATGVRAEKTLTNGLRLIKDFQLTTNYQLRATVRIENQSAQPVRLPRQEWVIGTATPLGTNDNGLLMGLYWYDGAHDRHIDESVFANRSLGCIPGTPRTEYESEGTNVVWAAVHNQFFTMVVMPQEPAPKLKARRRTDLPLPSDLATNLISKKFTMPFGYQTAFVYPETVLKPNGAWERRFDIFAGPREYNTLARLGHDQDLVMGFGGFFGFFAKALLLSMNGLNALGLRYGLAIIAITVIIKLLFWPLTQASTRSMKRMAALQPQMKALQEKYKDDAKKMNQKLMEFMKENKVSPLGGCLPMLLQIPVFFGFYRMLQTAIELRGASFLWACDLSQSDTIYRIPGLDFPVNPLPLLMGATMFWQARMTPPSPGMDPVQQKIMKYLPMMFMVFLYNVSAGLTLYWTVQNLLTIAQMKLIKTTNEPAPAQAVKPPVRTVPPKKKKG